MEDRWLSVDEIAAYLGIKRDTVYKWIADKQMPAHRVGRLWKFRKEEVDGWVRAGKAAEAATTQPDLPAGRQAKGREDAKGHRLGPQDGAHGRESP